jgi:hypothetical protein
MTLNRSNIVLGLLLMSAALPAAYAHHCTIYTVAGQQVGESPVPGADVAVGFPTAIATDPKGNVPKDVAQDGARNIYIADTGNNVIRAVNTAGVISTIAGTGDAAYFGDQGPSSTAQLNRPTGIATYEAGNIHVVDTANARVRKISTSGVISAVATGGNCEGSRLTGPFGIKFDAQRNLYIADTSRVRMLLPAGSVLSGDGGPAAVAPIGAWRLAFDSSGNLFVADPWNNVIHKLTLNR